MTVPGPRCRLLTPRTLPRHDRARAALLAHACGDRFDAPLEFLGDASVRTSPVHLDDWTDDTHMSLYLGEVILAHGPGPLQPERFGQMVGEAFVRWRHDPLTPSTAPGNTCLEGVARFERERDWTPRLADRLLGLTP